MQLTNVEANVLLYANIFKFLSALVLKTRTITILALRPLQPIDRSSKTVND
jgi:hypothetical protein